MGNLHSSLNIVSFCSHPLSHGHCCPCKTDPCLQYMQQRLSSCTCRPTWHLWTSLSMLIISARAKLAYINGQKCHFCAAWRASQSTVLRDIFLLHTNLFQKYSRDSFYSLEFVHKQIQGCWDANSFFGTSPATAASPLLA